jgi:hypothetical protein
MDVAIQAGGTFGLLITRGACHPNFEVQASCEAGCSTQTVCDRPRHRRHALRAR